MSIITEKESKFTFTNTFPAGKCVCIMTIKMIHYYIKAGSKNSRYNLSYSYEFPESYSGNVGRTGLDNPAHPFYQTKCDCTGVIIHHNRMTEHMIEYLFMDDKSLEKEIGFKTADGYRASILIALDRLWD